MSATLCALATLALRPLLQPGIAYSDDIVITVYRVFALHDSWRLGIFYPRVAPVLAFGYGAPLFLFYPPLASYLAGAFTLAGLGWIAAVKLSFAVAILAAGFGAYRLGRALLPTRSGALLAASIYLLAPYQLGNLYVRGALAEALALGWMPWILWLTHRVIGTDSAGWTLAAGLSLAVLFITHNGQSLVFLPVLTGFAVAVAYQQRALRGLLRMPLVVGPALALSAFFWLPALLERSLFNVEAMSQGYYDPVNHLVGVHALLQTSLLFDYTRPQAFQWGWFPALLCLIVLVAGRVDPHRRWIWLVFWTALIASVLVLQLTIAAGFWRNVPLVAFLQFPWRLLGPASLAAAMLIGALPSALARGRTHTPRLRLQAVLAGGCLLLWGVYSLGTLGQYVAEERARGIFVEETIGYRDLYERGRLGLELFTDFTPLTVPLPIPAIPDRPPLAGLQAASLEPLPHILLDSYRGFTFAAEISANTATHLQLNRFFLPGWWATADGLPIPVHPSGPLGLATIPVPGGSTWIEAGLAETPIQRWSMYLSLLSLTGWMLSAGVLLYRSRARLFWLAAGAILVAGLALLLAVHSLGRHTQLVPINAQIGHSATLLGYTVDRTTVTPGATIHVTLYWQARHSDTRDYRVFVHLRDLEDTWMAAQHDGAPGHGFLTTALWQPGELYDDTHPLTLDRALAPGIYQIVVGLYDPDTVRNLAVTGAGPVLEGNRLVLGTVKVVAR